ncbi:MAG: urea ABC transporter permease subunit UrtB, partial [Rhodoferax sp.]|nr:urea ABC transporter permease subunit UrtB [Rhodoferax sp.]
MTARMLRWLTLVLLMAGGAAQALTAEQARAIAAGDTDDRIAAMNQTLDQADERTAAFLQALGEDAVKLSGDRVFIVRGDKTIDAVTG